MNSWHRRIRRACAVVLALGGVALAALAMWFFAGVFTGPGRFKHEAEVGFMIASIGAALLWLGAGSIGLLASHELPTWVARYYQASWLLAGLAAAAALTILSLS